MASSPENAKSTKDDAFVLTDPVYAQDCGAATAGGIGPSSSSAANSPTIPAASTTTATGDVHYAPHQAESPGVPQNGQEASKCVRSRAFCVFQFLIIFWD